MIPVPATFWDWIIAGNAPAYLTVLVASTAAWFAYQSSLASRRSADAAARQLERLEDDRVSEQARVFAAWSVSYGQLSRIPDGPLEPGTALPLYETVYNLRYYVQNPSELPFHNVSLYLATDALYFVGHIDHLPPNQEKPQLISTSVVATTVPTGRMSLPMGGLFIDAQHRYWDRLPDSQLRRLTEREYNAKLAIAMHNSIRMREAVSWSRSDRAALFRIVRV